MRTVKIEIKGKDYTPFESFTVLSEDEAVKDLEDPAKIVKEVFDHAFLNEDSIFFKKDSYFLMDIYGSGADLKYRPADLFMKNNAGVAGLIGYFSIVFTLPEGSSALGALSESDAVMVDARVSITSRFDSDSKPFFLIKMLETVDADLDLLGGEPVNSSEEEIWDRLLVQLYKNSILKLRRLGFYRRYVYKESNDTKVRGSIDLSRHIRLNCGLNTGRVACSYRENTQDNPLNHFMIRAYEMVKDMFPEQLRRVEQRNSEFNKIIASLRSIVPSYVMYSDRSLLEANRKAITSPFYQPYEEMRQICMRIFRRRGISLMMDKEDFFADGFLVYVPDLFEQYFQRVLESIYGNKAVRAQAEKTVSKRYDSIGSIRPDFVIGNEYILDTKFKPWYSEYINMTRLDTAQWYESPKYRLFDEDSRKLLRDMREFRCAAGGLVYPATGRSGISKLSAHYFGEEEYVIYSIPLQIPDGESESYDDWSREYEGCISSFSADLISSFPVDFE